MDRRIMFNEDDTHFFFTRDGWENLGEKEIRDLIRQYEGTGIGDFLLCCAGHRDFAASAPKGALPQHAGGERQRAGVPDAVPGH